MIMICTVQYAATLLSRLSYHYVDDDDDDDDVDDVDDYEDDVYEDEVSDDDMYCIRSSLL